MSLSVMRMKGVFVERDKYVRKGRVYAQNLMKNDQDSRFFWYQK